MFWESGACDSTASATAVYPAAKSKIEFEKGRKK